MVQRGRIDLMTIMLVLIVWQVRRRTKKQIKKVQSTEISF